MGKSQVNLPQMPPDSGGICMGFDQKNYRFAPGLPPGRLSFLLTQCNFAAAAPPRALHVALWVHGYLAYKKTRPP